MTVGRRKVLVTVFVLIGAAPLLALGEAVSFYAHNAPTGSLISSGQRRDYVLYVPPSYEATKPMPLVISLHGAASWGAAQRDISDWNEVADQHGFIVVYPSAVRRGPRVWGMDTREPGADVRFIAELIDTLSAHYRIDPARVYANGLSNGGGFSFVLSCFLSDRIAAVGLVGAALPMPFHPCAHAPPVPVIAFHGTADRFARYHGGRSWVARQPFADVPGFVAKWARRNQCAAAPVDSMVAPDVVRRAYRRCAQNADVVLYSIEGGGHAWPGGPRVSEWALGKTTQSIDASRLMWKFFQAHPRPQGVAR